MSQPAIDDLLTALLDGSAAPVGGSTGGDLSTDVVDHPADGIEGGS